MHNVAIMVIACSFIYVASCNLEYVNANDTMVSYQK